jgi:hypothetical protein
VTAAAVREGLRRLDGWLVRLWLVAPFGGSGPGRWHARRQGKLDYQDTGPMTGIIRIPVDPTAEAFLLDRPGRAAVRILYAQVSVWQEVASPLLPPVEEIPRP